MTTAQPLDSCRTCGHVRRAHTPKCEHCNVPGLDDQCESFVETVLVNGHDHNINNVSRHDVSLGDVLVDLSHDIKNAMAQGIDGTTWTPVPPQEDEAYLHGVADGVRWLLGTLMVGAQDPEEVPITDEYLEILAGVMYHFGERGVMAATLTLKEI